VTREDDLKIAALLLVFISALAAATSAAAQTSAPSGTTLITLGTVGGPLPQARRAQSSNLLIVNGTLYLIDAGGGVTGRIVQSGNNFRAVSKIFITHLHSDHDAGLATLLVSEWEQQAPPIDVYGSGVEALVKGAIAYLQPNADIRWSEGKKRPMSEAFRAHESQPGVIYQDPNVKVTAVENSHFHFQPEDPAYGKFRSYSYRFETPDKVVFFTGDTGPSDDVVELAKGADLYVTETTSPDDLIELYKKTGIWQSKTQAEQEGFLRHIREEHVTPEDIGKMAAKAGVKAVVMTHIGPSIDPNDDYQRYIDEAKKYYSGPITLAKDLMKF
jgi:ribonuclease BN (tRNA processing enzyme)